MGTRVLLSLAVPALVVALAAALGARRHPSLGSDAEVDAGVRALAAVQRRVAWLAVLAAVVFALLAVELLGDRSVYVALPGAVAVLGAARLLAERLVPAPPPGAPRTAVLERRERDDYVSRQRVLLMRGCAVAAAAVGVGTVLAAAPDGRSLALACATVVDGTSTLLTEASGPFPGAVYAVPGLVVLLVTVLLAETTLRRVVLRPRPSPSAARVVDDGLRTASARACVRSGTAVALLLLVGLSLPAGMQLSTTRCGGSVYDASGGLLLALAGLGALALLALAVDTGRAAGERTAGRVASTPVGASPR